MKPDNCVTILVVTNQNSFADYPADDAPRTSRPSLSNPPGFRRFCQAFMSAMTKHIGTEIDFPSMGACVGGPEIGYLYGQVGLENRRVLCALLI